MTPLKRVADGCIGLGTIVFGYTIAFEFATTGSPGPADLAFAASLALLATGVGTYFIEDALVTDRDPETETDTTEVSA